MLSFLRICGLLSAMLVAPYAGAQVGAESTDQNYRLRVAVDEVILTFHAVDAQGLPISDLKLGELHLLDNDKPPRSILSFDTLADMPLHAGVLLDTSASMAEQMARTRAFALLYAQKLLSVSGDQAFVMDFGYSSHLQQDWTSNAGVLAAAIRNVRTASANSLNGTAIFDTVFRACYSQFGHGEHDKSGNLILLFSDGQDNASHISMDEAIRMCQRSNTVIYAFRMDPANARYSTGPETLTQLALKTGGRVMRASDMDAEIDADLRSIETEMRNQYRIVYSPATFLHDGSFHRIELDGPDRVATMQLRSGYYAPTH